MSVRRSRWRRVLLWAMGLAVVLRVALAVGLVPLLGALAGAQGFELRIEHLRLRLLSLSAEVRGLELRAAGAAADETPLLRLDHLVGDVRALALLRGVLSVRRAEIDGLSLQFERDAAGRWNWPAVGGEGEAEADEPEPRAPRPRHDDRAPFPLNPPLEIDAALVQHLRVQLRDQGPAGPREHALQLDLRLTDFGRADRPARFELLGVGEGWLDHLRLHGTLEREGAAQPDEVAPEALRLGGELSLAGLAPGPLAPWLAEFGLAPLAEQIEARGRLALALAASGDGGPLRAELSLTELAYEVDLEPVLALESLTLEIPHWSQASLRGLELSAAGGRARLGRTAEGHWRAAGFALLPQVAEADETQEEPAEPARSAGPDSAPAEPGAAAPQPPFQIAEVALAIRDGQLEFVDEAAPGGTARQHLRLESLALRGVDWPLVPGSETTELELTAAVDDSLGALRIAGRLTPRDDGLSAELGLELDALTLQSLRPYLSAAGLGLDLQSATAQSAVQVDVARDPQGVTVAAQAAGLVLRDGERTLADLGRLELEGLQLPSNSALRLGALTLRELRLPVRRETDGTLRAAGLALPGGGGPSAPMALTLRLDEAALTQLDLAPAPDEHAALRLRAAVTGLVEELSVDGELRVDAAEGAAQLRAQFGARGIDPAELEPWLTEAGLESRLAGAEGSGRAVLEVGPRSAGQALQVELADWRLVRGAEEIFALDRLHLAPTYLAAAPSGLAAAPSGLAAAPSGLAAAQSDPLRIGAVAVSGLRATVTRDEWGVLEAVGLRLAAPVAEAGAEVVLEAVTPVLEPGAEPANDAASAPGAVASGALSPAAADEAPRFGGPLPLPRLEFGGLELSGAQLTWREAGATRTVDFGATLAALQVGPEARPAAYRLTLHSPELLEVATVEGQVQLAPDDLSVQGRLQLAGLRGAGQAPPSPRGPWIDLERGEARAEFRAALTAGEVGGRRLEVELRDVELADAAQIAGPPRFALRELVLRAPRLDPEGAIFQVDEVRVEGLSAEVQRDEDGTWHALGLALPPAAVAAEQPTAEQPTAEQPAAEQPAAEQPAADEPAADEPAPVAAATSPPAALPASFPAIRLERLDLALEALRIVDRTQGADAEAVVLSGRLENTEPWQILSAAPDELPPLVARLSGSLAPVVGSVELTTTVQPFAAAPNLRAELAISAVDGAGFERAWPQLTSGLTAPELRDGRLRGALDLELALRRRHPLDFDLRDGFGARLELSEFDLREGSTDERWLGLESATVELTRLRPDTGEVHVGRVELDQPFARARVQGGALEFFGLRLPLEPPAQEETEPAEPSAAAAEERAAEEAPAEEEVAAQTEGAPIAGAPAAAAPEVRIDRLWIQGLDLELADLDAEPPVRIPLRELDLEVSGFTTRTLTEPVPFRFSAYLGAGTVDLPVPQEPRGGLIGGVLSGVVTAATDAVGLSEEQEVELEPRPLFQEIGTSGQLSLGPAPRGWVRAHVLGFELLGLRGLARRSGVKIGGGLVDFSTRVRLSGEDGLSLDSRTVFEDLSLSEPAGGPISRWLLLPAPLDTVLFLLRDQQGQIELPVDIDLSRSGLSLTELTRLITTTLARLIADAVASSPLRVTGSLTNLVGLGRVEESRAPVVSRAEYPRGGTELSGEAQATLERALDALADDRRLELTVEQTLGAADLEQAERRANPDPDRVLALARQLERRLADLAAQRATLAAQSRAAWLTGHGADDPELSDILRQTEARIGRAERALDELYGRLRPGEERRQDQRTRAGALALAELRQDAVLDIARARLGEGPLDRIEFRRPRLDAENTEPVGTLVLTLRRRR
jgi:hypothetical protein